MDARLHFIVLRNINYIFGLETVYIITIRLCLLATDNS